ncbi:hypothetical protein ABZV60_35900 [Streptomyces sp. NPDC004787]|uniref:ATP-grasp domain-containing protein n=1 Tax=Streptomyces sp. NPDC004787 TaxID=3154291 RepID=UPI0033B41D43
MSISRVAIVTCDAGIEWDADLPLIAHALSEAGLAAEAVAWDSAATWGAFDAAVIRSTWDYVDHVGDFLDWADTTAASTLLLNPAPMVRWNSDKRYLMRLAQKGVPVVPTHFLLPGKSYDPAIFEGINDIVVKPSISAGAVDTARYEGKQRARAIEHAQMLLSQNRGVMVQPYLPLIERGERALIFFSGSFSHAIKKQPLLTDSGVIDNERIPHQGVEPYRPTNAEILVAQAALEAIPSPQKPLFARVDLVLDHNASPVILELELIEPNLFLQSDPEGLIRFKQAVLERIR